MTGDDVIARAAWHEQHFSVSPARALDRARRELEMSDYRTPWEIRDSAYVAEQIGAFFAAAFVTLQ